MVRTDGPIFPAGPLELDEHFLRRSFDVARRAMTHGNHPFGAFLVDLSGSVLSSRRLKRPA